MKNNSMTNVPWDCLWINVNLATMSNSMNAYGEVLEAAIAVNKERIVWLGERKELPSDLSSIATKVIDCNGQWMTPGLIDCHTHLVYGGNRAGEFEASLQGASYEEIAQSGGGIRSTVKATRASSEGELVASAGKRLSSLLKEGVTTIEIKSGYGLQLSTELIMLRAAKKLQKLYPVHVITTFLGAHTIPKEFASKREDYVSLICNEMLPAIVNENLADAVDVFCETIGFSLAETERIIKAAIKLSLPIKLHADQLSDTGSAGLAARYNALSADHLEYSSKKSVELMGKHDCVAVLLPGAFYFIGETQCPPIELLREYNVPIAIATDSNPGSSPTSSLLLMMNMACTLFQLTPLEVLAGVTRNAAKALAVDKDRGTLEVGKRADFSLWDINDPAELCYWLGANHCTSVVKNGMQTNL